MNTALKSFAFTPASHCIGLRKRVRLEVFAWATAPHSEEREQKLAYWHARQRSADALYYRLRQYAPRVPTRNEVGAEKHQDRYAVGSWTSSSEYHDEQRQMGLSAL